MKRVLPYFLGVAIIVFAIGYFVYQNTPPVFWIVNEAQSEVSFTSVKNGDIEETHTIKDVSGRTDITGTFYIDIDLNSAETNIDIRNERMKDILFETASYAVATFNGQFEPEDIIRVSVGGSVITRINGTLTLHGVSQPLSADVEVIMVSEEAVIVSSLNPIEINVADFGMSGGLDTLRGLAGLDSINPVSEVTFTLGLEPRSVSDY